MKNRLIVKGKRTDNIYIINVIYLGIDFHGYIIIYLISINNKHFIMNQVIGTNS